MAAYVGGEKVVDLWGRPSWQRDTLVLVYSTSKGLSAMTLALLHSRGLLDYDERVSTYWPEFARAGKEQVTVRQLLAHEAGLPVIDEPLDAAAGRLDRLAGAIAGPAAALDASEHHGYHGVQPGLVRGRAGPADRSAAAWALLCRARSPLGLDVHFGVPDDVPRERIARIERVPLHKAAPQMRHLPSGWRPPWSTRARSATAPSPTRACAHPADLDRDEYRHVEFPAGGAVGSARSIARAYSAFTGAATKLGLSTETLANWRFLAAGAQRRDRVLKVDTAFSLGFARPLSRFRVSSSSRSFGHQARAAFAFADPDCDVSFAYVMNRLGFHLNDDPREKPLRSALYRCL